MLTQKNGATVIKYNPFKPSNLFPPGIFTGRANEVSALVKILNQTKNENPQHFIIEGERGIGKSSLFFFLNSLATNGDSFNFLVVNVDLTENMLYSDIIKKIAAEIKSEFSRIKDVATLAKDAWSFIQNWEVLGVKYRKDEKVELTDFELLDHLTFGLEKIYTEIKGSHSGILILIDEADKPSETAKLGEIIKLATERLTKRACPKICFGLAGLPTVVQKLRAGHEASPRIFQNFSLEPLAQPDREKVIDNCLEEAEQINGFFVSITAEAKRRLGELSEGYPHFLQQFGYDSFEEDSDKKIDINDVQRGLEKANGSIDQLGHKYFATQYFEKINSDDYRKVLQTLAEHGDSWVSRADLNAETGLSSSTINNAIKALKERGIISLKEGQRGEYRIPTKSFAIWIKVAATTWIKQ